MGKTGRFLTVEDDCLTGGVGAEVGATVAESVTLASPIARVGCADVPMPCCEPLERAALPTVARVIAAVERIVESPDELVHRLHHLEILDSDGEVSLVTKHSGRPSKSRASDHLPVFFQLDM